jgi:hypothetical protein
LQNTAGSAVAYSNWYISNNAFWGPDTLNHWLRPIQSEGGGTAASWSSGGVAHTARDTDFIWDIGSRFSSMADSPWRFMMALSSVTLPNGAYARLNLFYVVSAVYLELWHGDEVYLENAAALVDLGVIPMPRSDDLTEIYVGVTFRATGAGSVTYDAVQMSPAHSHRRLRQQVLQLGIGDDDSVVDDGILGEIYVKENSTSDVLPVYQAYNDPVYLYPGRTQRLYILNCSGATNVWTAGRTVSVQAWYRPRLSTV